MIDEANVNEGAVGAEIHGVAHAAYALEAARIACADFPPLSEAEDDLRRSSDLFLVLRQGGRIVAALSFAVGAETVAITRLVVDPAYLRRGIATALLKDIERRFPGAACFTVCTANANTPAVTLYHRLGYVSVGFSNSPEGISLVHLTKSNDRGA